MRLINCLMDMDFLCLGHNSIKSMSNPCHIHIECYMNPIRMLYKCYVYSSHIALL